MDYSRQKDVFDNDKFDLPVHIIGCGATGSWVAMQLAKLGIKDLHFHDFDTVEEHNIPNQLFMMTDMGSKKAVAAACNAQLFGGVKASTYDEEVTGETPLSGVVFILTDTMKSRSEIYKNALKNNVHVGLVIETRMGTDSGRVYAFDPKDRKQYRNYEDTLYSDEAAAVSMCGVAQSLAPTAALVASMAVWQLIKFAAGEKVTNEFIFDARHDTYLTREFK